MKHPLLRDETARFSGNLRHYHRSNSQSPRTWDEWVDGKSTRARGSGKWLKIIAIAVAVLALGGIVVGLIIELR